MASELAGDTRPFMVRLSRARFALLLLLLAAGAVFIELGRMDVESANEGQRAAPPIEMIQQNDYVIPTLNYEPYLAKPPLLYWTIAALYTFTGSYDELIARLPGALCAVALVLLIYLGFRKEAGEGPARWTALAFGSAPYFLERARWANLDTPLLLSTFLTLLLLWRAWRAEAFIRRLLLATGAGIALGAATMLKGPPPYLFVFSAFAAHLLLVSPAPGHLIGRLTKWTIPIALIACVQWLLPLASYAWSAGAHVITAPFPVALALFALLWGGAALYTGRGRLLRDGLPLLLTLVLGLGAAVPWGVAVLQRMSWSEIQALLASEVVTRTYAATAINSGSLFFYLRGIIGMLAPWGLLLPLHLSRRHWREDGQGYRFGIVFGWLSLALFSLIAGKEYEYVLPAAPFLLLPTGYHLAGIAEGSVPGWMAHYGRIWGRAVGWLLALGAPGLFVYVLLDEFHPWLAVETGAIALLVLALWFWPGRREGRFGVLARVALATWLVVTSALLTRSFHYTGDRSPREMGLTLRALADAGYRVEAVDMQPGMIFYTRRPIPVVFDPRRALDDAYVTRQVNDIRAKMSGQKPYFFLAREKFMNAVHAEDLLISEPLVGPVTNKDWILLGNGAGAAAFEAMFPARSAL